MQAIPLKSEKQYEAIIQNYVKINSGVDYLENSHVKLFFSKFDDKYCIRIQNKRNNEILQISRKSISTVDDNHIATYWILCQIYFKNITTYKGYEYFFKHVDDINIKVSYFY